MLKELSQAAISLKKTAESFRIEKKSNSLEEMKASIILDKGQGYSITGHDLSKNDDGSFTVCVQLQKENAPPLQQYQGRYDYKNYRATSTDLQSALGLVNSIGA